MNRLPLHIEAAAEAEMAEAADYLERDQEGLGARFLADLAGSLDRIHATPESQALVLYEPRARSARIGRFGFRVYFVIAVGRATRKPGFWRDRLK